MKIPTVEVTEVARVTARPGEAGRVWRAARGLGAEGERLALTIAQQHGELRKKKKALDDTVFLSSLEVRAKRDLAQLEIELMRSPDPYTHYQRWETGFNEMANSELGGIKDKELQARATVLLNRLKASEVPAQEHFADRLWVEKMQAGTQLLLDSYAETGELEKGEELLATMTEHGVYSANISAKMLIGFSDAVEKKRIKTLVDAADLEIFYTPNATEKILSREENADIPNDEKLILLKKGIARTNQIESDIEKAVTKASEDLYAGLVEKVREGKSVERTIYDRGPAGDRTLIRQHFDSLFNQIDAVAKGGITSDPDTLLNVTIRSSKAVPEITEDQIEGFMREKLLSVDDGNAALDQIRTTNRSLRSEAERENNKDYRDAEKEIERGMGVSGLILTLTEKLDPTQMGLIARAKTELWNRSRGRGGKEDAMEVARDILPKYQRALAGQNLLSIETYEKLIEIDKYPDVGVLRRSYDEDRLSEDDYYRKAGAFKEMQEKMRLNEYLKIRQTEFKSGREQ